MLALSKKTGQKKKPKGGEKMKKMGKKLTRFTRLRRINKVLLARLSPVCATVVAYSDLFLILFVYLNVDFIGASEKRL